MLKLPRRQQKIKPGVFIREVAVDCRSLNLSLLNDSDVYQRLKKPFHSAALARNALSLEEFFSDDIDFLHLQELSIAGDEAEYSFEPLKAIETVNELQAYVAGAQGRIGMSKAVRFLDDLQTKLREIVEAGNRFRLILESGGVLR